MTIRTSPWPAGMPCWTDLSTPDVAAAKSFYTEVLGWGWQDTEDTYGGYAIAEVDGSAVAGVGPRHGDAPVAWTLYLASDDVETLAQKAAEEGGQVLLAPDDVGALGRMGRVRRSRRRRLRGVAGR